jgi:hypothetical protein
MFPFAIIPFTYVMSFLFTNVSGAQTFAMFFNFGLIVFGSSLIFLGRWIPEWEAGFD